MKKLLHFITLLPFLALLSPIQAQTFWGGEIYYDHIAQDSFEVTVVVYKDCNSSGNISDTAFIHSSCGTDTIYLSISQGQDITPDCYNVASRCSNPNSSFPYGIKRYEMKGVFIANSSCCEYTISWAQCCRISTLATGGGSTNMYLEAKLNSCLSTPNNSPRFLTKPFLLACVGNCIEYNPGLFDDDRDASNNPLDSFAVSLIAPKTASNTNITYSGTFDYDKPVNFTGFPNNTLPFNPPLCRGFHLNSQTGILSFRPTMVQEGVIAIKVDEYRNGVKIGEVMREMSMAFFNCPSNYIDINFSINSLDTVCLGDSISFNVTANFNNTDSLLLGATNLPAGASFTVTPGTTANGVFSWKPGPNDIGTIPHYLFFTARAVDCVFYTIPETKTMNIKVSDTPSVSVTSQELLCGKAGFNAILSPTNASINWLIDSVPFSAISTVTTEFATPGKYPFELNVAHDGCKKQILDTIEITSSPLEITLGADVLTCMGDSVMLQSQILSGNGSYIYEWNPGQLSTSQLNVIAEAPSKAYSLKVTDSHQCEAFDTIKVETHPLPIMCNIAKQSLCENSGVYSLSNLCTLNVNWSGAGVSGTAFDPTVAGRGTHKIYYSFTDSFNCSHLDSFEIEALSSYPDVILPTPPPRCINHSPFSLTSRLNGEWSGNGVINNYFYPDLAGVGVHALENTTLNSYGCESKQTVNLRVEDLPEVTTEDDLELCINSGIYTLSASPTFGSWKGTALSGLMNIYFDPSIAGVGIHELIYTYFEITCSNSDTLLITVTPIPDFSISYDVEGSTSKVNFSLTTNENLGNFFWDFGDGNTSTDQNPGHEYSFSDTTFIVFAIAENQYGCFDTMWLEVHIPLATSIHTLELKKSIVIFPNPVNDILKVQSQMPAGKIHNVQVVDVTGRRMGVSYQMEDGLIEVEVSTLESGIYFLTIETNTGMVLNYKFYKQ